MKIISGCDIDRTQSLQNVIDLLVKETNWEKFEAMMVELDEPGYAVQISVIKKDEANDEYDA